MIEENLTWGKSLEKMPTVTIKEIEAHRSNAGKCGETIAKTMDRGRKFKEERYINANNIWTADATNLFYIKSECTPSMGALGTSRKKPKTIKIILSNPSGEVQHASCTCRQGDGGLCHHVVALLLELAEYSLAQLKQVPDELACTSNLRAWGIPGQVSMTKEPVMASTIYSRYNKRGTTCTLYDPRINNSRKDVDDRLCLLEQRLKTKDFRIGFAHCRDSSTTDIVNTPYGGFLLGSPLSFHLAPIESNISYLTNIEKTCNTAHLCHNFVHLPLIFLDGSHDAYPDEWVLNEKEITFLKSLIISPEESYEIEQETITQSKCEKWFEMRKNRITSSKAHLVYKRKRQFENLAANLLNPTPKSNLPAAVRDAIDFGINNEPIARGKYYNILKFVLNRDAEIRETGLVIQPNLFWTAASPDGLISDKDSGIGLIEIKCPKSKKSLPLNDIVNDPSFYVEMVDGVPQLKRNHDYGYFTQIQMAMGLAGVSYCDFVVYTFSGLIIIRTPFDNDYFIDLMRKINSFYKNYMLQKLCETNDN